MELLWRRTELRQTGRKREKLKMATSFLVVSEDVIESGETRTSRTESKIFEIS